MLNDPSYSEPGQVLRRLAERVTGYVVATEQVPESPPMVIDHAQRTIRIQEGLDLDQLGVLIHRAVECLVAGRR